MLWPASWLVSVFECSLSSVLRVLGVVLTDLHFSPDADEFFSGAFALLLMSPGHALSCVG